MGFLSDIKRLLWVNKAVAESAADKVVEKGREITDDIADKVSDTWHKGKDKAEEISDKIVTKTKEGYKDVKEKATDMWDKKDDWTQKDTPKEPNEESTTFKAGEKLGETVGKVKEAAEETWDKAKEQGKELLDKAVKTSDKLWEKAEDTSEDLWEKAKNVATKATDKFHEGVDSMLEKAKDLDKKIQEEKDKIDPNGDGWADKPISEKLREHDSTLKGKDDFFERAERFAEGDYSMGKPVVTKKNEEEPLSEEGRTPLPPLPKDDIIDDAILDDEDDKK
ncbi:MAG TPA: hypothetical protein VFG10_08210 [Saprospiraceae bacterium]|nr:hypothetical protein [Saprospiraceae bacterium]